MALTSLTPWQVGQYILTATLNLAQTAIGELQALATPKQFTATKTTAALTTGADTAVGTWTTASGYTASGSGLMVPDTGVYVITLRSNRTSGAWSTRAYLALLVGSTIYRNSIDAGVGEDNACITAVTDSIAAGTLITPKYWTGTAANAAFTLNIVKLPLDA